MSYTPWLEYLTNADKQSQIHGKRMRVHYKFADDREMFEIYNLETDVVETRAWRTKRLLSTADKWEYELGEKSQKYVEEDADPKVVVESSTSPLLVKRITKKNIEWRVSNLPYALEVYNVQAEPSRNAIIISTTNKKYYKVLQVPELQRCGLKPEQNNITVHHQHNTLIVTYRKPELLNEMEAHILLMVKNIPTKNFDMRNLLDNFSAD